MKENQIINQWYRNAIIASITLALAYVIAHYAVSGNEIIKLSKQEMADVNLILFGKGDNDTSLTPDNETRRNLVYNYISSVRHINASELESLKKRFKGFDAQQFAGIIANYPIRTTSYFWLTESMVYLEIIFWSWFGLLANLFFSVSEAYRLDKFDVKEIKVHISKIFYAPLSAMVIFLSITILSTSGDLEVVEFSHSTIVLSFILGFFSRRSIDLLNRIKDIILPLGKSETSRVTTSDAAFEELPMDDKYTLMNEAVESNYEQWKKDVSNFTGVQVGKKTKKENGSEVETEVDAIVFQVSEKSDKPEAAVPDFVLFKGYKIPTDVVEASVAIPHTYQPPSVPLPNIAPGKICPGAGISRLNDNAEGTLGLKVYRDNDDQTRTHYILSCYHVLFSTETNSNVFVKNTTANTSNEAIVCPSGGTNTIAHVREGCVSRTIDAAIAEIVNSSIVDRSIHSLRGPLAATRQVTADDIKIKLEVNIYGRHSGKQKGVIKGVSAKQTIPYTTKSWITLSGLISVGKISEGGDSGAIAVTNAGAVVGMVIGGDNKFSYLVPIDTILSELNVKIE